MRDRSGLATLICLAALGAQVPAAQGQRRDVGNLAEFDRAVAAARAGDVIVMADGVWRDVVLDFEARGEQRRPIVLRAETAGKVTLSGQSQLYIGGEHLVVEGLRFAEGALSAGRHVIQFRSRRGEISHHCRLSECAIVDYSPPWPESDQGTQRYFYVVLFGTHHRVDRCCFSGHNNSGVTLCCALDEQPDFHRIDRNYFGPRSAPPQQIKQRNGYETIRIGTSTFKHTNPRVTVEGNYFYRCNGEGEIISNKSHENVYRNNVFAECEGALTIRQGNRCTIDGNHFLGNHKPNTGGIRVTREDHLITNNQFHQLAGTGSRAALCLMNGVETITGKTGYVRPRNVLIAFNTFVDCRQTLILGYGFDSRDGSRGLNNPFPPTDCTLANNVFAGNGTDAIVTRETEPVDLRWQGNFAYGSPLGIPVPPGVELADPQVAADADGLLRPARTSPLIDAAVGNYPRVTVDIDGQDRVDPKDVGADELSGQAAPRRRPTPATVGPGWRR